MRALDNLNPNRIVAAAVVATRRQVKNLQKQKFSQLLVHIAQCPVDG